MNHQTYSRIQLLFIPLALGCHQPEEGINNTLIQGTVTIAPVVVSEGADDAANDDWSGALELPELGYQYLQVNGNASQFATWMMGEMEEPGDVDTYLITVGVSGEYSLIMDFETEGTETDDYTQFEVTVYDTSVVSEAEQDTGEAAPPDDTGVVPDTGAAGDTGDTGRKGVAPPDEPGWSVSYTGSTDGTGGHFEVALTLEAGITYGVEVFAHSAVDVTSADYKLLFSGQDPNETDVLVGAYLSGDPYVHGDPVGGATVKEFVLDSETYTWSGEFEIMYLRRVVQCEEADQACISEAQSTTGAAVSTGSGKDMDTGEAGDTGEQSGGDTGQPMADEPATVTIVQENITSAYLLAAMFSSLNNSLSSGTFFSSTPVLVDGLSMDETVEGVVLSMDDVVPIFYGWEYEESGEPNDVAISGASYSPLDVAELEASAEVLPVGSGMYAGSLSYTDMVLASLTSEEETTDWGGGDVDFFAVTVDETVGATFFVGWEDAAVDIDVMFYGLYEGEYWLYAYAAGLDNPEMFNTVDFGFYLEPGETYYIGILGYTVPVGSTDYTIQIEYSQP